MEDIGAFSLGCLVQSKIKSATMFIVTLHKLPRDSWIT